jgi:hypothetical protein
MIIETYYDLFFEFEDSSIHYDTIVAADDHDANNRLNKALIDLKSTWGLKIRLGWFERLNTVAYDTYMYLVLTRKEFNDLAPRLGDPVRVHFKKVSADRTIQDIRPMGSYYYLRINK